MGHGFHITLGPVWAEWDERVFALVAALHRRLPPANPPITLHGRQLEPVSEGVGAQYQLTMNGPLYDGRYRAAYYVIQIQLLRRSAPAALGAETPARLVWRVDAMPVLERDGGRVEAFARRRDEIPLAESQRLADLFGTPLTDAATEFFRR